MNIWEIEVKSMTKIITALNNYIYKNISRLYFYEKVRLISYIIYPLLLVLVIIVDRFSRFINYLILKMKRRETKKKSSTYSNTDTV